MPKKTAVKKKKPEKIPDITEFAGCLKKHGITADELNRSSDEGEDLG